MCEGCYTRMAKAPITPELRTLSVKLKNISTTKEYYDSVNTKAGRLHILEDWFIGNDPMFLDQLEQAYKNKEKDNSIGHKKSYDYLMELYLLDVPERNTTLGLMIGCIS